MASERVGAAGDGRRRKGLSALLLLTALLVTMLPLSEGDLTTKEKTQIMSGLDTGKTIANFMSSGNFKESMKKIGTSIGKYLGVLSPFMGLVLTSVSIPPELQYMKNMMREIDARFDQLDKRIDEIERQVVWTAKEVTFGQIELKILSVAYQYERVYEVPPEGTTVQKEQFVRAYNNNYDISGYILYQASVGSFTFLENLGVSVMRYTDNDRKETHIYLLGIMQLLLQAAKIEIAYYQAINSTVIAEDLARVWEERITEVKDKFNEFDSEVASKYHEESSDDIDQYAEDNKAMSNKDFALGLKNMLEDKYYWRIWLVVIYNPISGSANHYVSQHGGFEKYRKYGRNIVIASKDSNSPKMSSSIAQERLESASVKNRAIDYFNGIQPAPNAGSWGVITEDSNIWYAWSGGTFNGWTGRELTCGWNHCILDIFKLFMWG